MAMRKPTNTKLQEEVQVKLMRRLTEEGYSDLTDFWRRSGIQVSHETVRRALHGGKPTSIESIIKIGAHLGLTNAELADMCRSLGDTFWPSKLWSPKANKRDEAVLGIVNRIAAIDAKYWTFFKVNAAVCAKAAGVDISEYLDVLRNEITNEEEDDFQNLQMPHL